MHSFRRKTSKIQQSDSGPYTLYNPHSIDMDKQNWKDRIRVISIDPGVQNYCIRVEERPFSENVKNREITMLLYDKLSLKRADVGLSEYNECIVYKILTNYLNSKVELFKSCHLVIIERQLPENYKATRIAQHTLSFFMFHLFNLPQLPVIIEINPKLKGKELGASTNLNSKGLKDWAIKEAHSLLTKRNDKPSLQCLAKTKKKDDLSDTVCQIEAFFKYMGWPETSEKLVSPIKVASSGKKLKLIIDDKCN